MISLCLATKRPEYFKQMWESAIRLADGDIEVCSYHDEGEPLAFEYPPNHKEVFGRKDVTILVMMNEAFKIATGPYFMFIADDFCFESKGWDTEIIKVFEEYEDKIVLVCPDGVWNTNRNFGTVGVVHKNWTDAVGYLIPDFRGSESADRWINDMAVAIGRRVRLENVRMKHFDLQDQIHEECHARNRRARRLYNSPEMIERRKKDADKLKLATFPMRGSCEFV